MHSSRIMLKQLNMVHFLTMVSIEKKYLSKLGLSLVPAKYSCSRVDLQRVLWRNDSAGQSSWGDSLHARRSLNKNLSNI
jgi:hypothetical protein